MHLLKTVRDAEEQSVEAIAHDAWMLQGHRNAKLLEQVEKVTTACKCLVSIHSIHARIWQSCSNSPLHVSHMFRETRFLCAQIAKRSSRTRRTT